LELQTGRSLSIDN